MSHATISMRWAAPERTVSLPPELVSEAGFDNCDRHFQE